MALTQVSTDGVKNDAISHNKIPANAIQASELADNAVDTAAIANSAVTNAKIADDAVTTAKIADDAVTSAKIAANAVGSSEIQDGNVIAAKLATSAVQTAKIADQAVTLAKLPHGDGSSDGKFLRANNGADPTFVSIPPAAITAIANTGANKVITDDGDGTVTAETNFSYDGTKCLIGTATGAPFVNRNLTVAQGGSSNTTVAIEVRSPTNGDGRIIFTDSTSSSDTGSYKGQIMYDQTNDFMQFGVNGAQEAMRIDGNKNLLVGTTSFNNGNFTGSGQGITVGGTAPQITLHRTDNDKDAFFGNNGTNAYLFTADSMPIVFGTGDAERMRISATGKVGMGGSPATSSTLRVFQPTATDYDAATAANNPAIIISAASGGGADGKCVGLSFNGPNANGEANFAMVGDGSNECNFHLSMRSGGTRKDVLKIEPVGKFQIGVSNSPSHAGVSIAASDFPSFRLWDDQMSDNFVIRYENSTQRVQFINNHNGAYLSRGGTGLSAYSDERLKTIVSNITGGFEKIKGLRTVIGHYNDDPDKYQKPFLIAQDVQAVLPEAVSTREPDKLTLCYTEVITLLTNALQESIAKIETLETKVAILESA